MNIVIKGKKDKKGPLTTADIEILMDGEVQKGLQLISFKADASEGPGLAVVEMRLFPENVVIEGDFETKVDEAVTEVTNENYLIFEDIIDQYGGYIFLIKADTIPQAKLISKEIADGKSFQGIVQLNSFSVSQLKELSLVELFDEGKTIRIGHKTAYSDIYDEHKKWMESQRRDEAVTDLAINHLIRTVPNLDKEIERVRKEISKEWDELTDPLADEEE